MKYSVYTQLRTCVALAFPLICISTYLDRPVAAEAESSTNYGHIRLERLQSGAASKDNVTEIQEALLSVVALALEYRGYEEAELMALSGTSQERIGDATLHISRPGKDGAKTEFRYSLQGNFLSEVHKTEADGGAVVIAFSPSYRSGTYLSEASVTVTNPTQDILLDFGEENSELLLVTLLEVSSAVGEFKGNASLLDNDGAEVAKLGPEIVKNPFDVRQRMIGKLTEEQLSMLGVGLSERLHASPAFQGADSKLKRVMDNLVGWSEKLTSAEPIFMGEALFGEDSEQIEGRTTTETIISQGGSPIWSVVRDKNTGHLDRATYIEGGLFLSFDIESPGSLLGGIGTVRRPKGDSDYWLISFYQSRLAPRMAIHAVGQGIGELRAVGNLHIWDRAGTQIFTEEISSEVTLYEALQRVESKLSRQKKSAIGWLGWEEEVGRCNADY